MKLFFLPIFVSIFFFGYSFSASAAVSYTNTAKTSIARYITTLKSKWSTVSQIIASLKSKQAYYTKLKSSTRYKGTYKSQVDAMLDIIQSTISTLSQWKDIGQGVSSQNTGMPAISSSQSGSQIQSVAIEIQDGIIYAHLNLANTGSSKEYDVYTFTPSNNYVINNQPLASKTISGFEKMISSSQNGYDIRLYFQPETYLPRVKSLSAFLSGSEYASKTSVIVTWTSNFQLFKSLTDQQFFSQATYDTKTYKWTYESYTVYIAKDSSEAFILRWNQIGSKIRIPAMTLKTYDFIPWSYQPRIYLKDTNAATYKKYIYAPVAGSTYTDTYMKLGIDTQIHQDFIQSMIFDDGKKYYTITGFPITFEQSKTYQKYFTLTGATMWAGEYTTFPVLGKSEFIKNRLQDMSYYTYQLLVSDDGSQSYLIEYQQLYDYGE